MKVARDMALIMLASWTVVDHLGFLPGLLFLFVMASWVGIEKGYGTWEEELND